MEITQEAINAIQEPDRYAGRMAAGWLPVTLKTDDQLSMIPATGEIINMSALRRKHDAGRTGCTYGDNCRLVVMPRYISCQWKATIVKVFREPTCIESTKAGKPCTKPPHHLTTAKAPRCTAHLKAKLKEVN